MGSFACDDVFIPIIDHVREQSNLYQLSNVYSAGSSHFEVMLAFSRKIKLYLNDPISPEENAIIEEMWQKQLEKEPYSFGSYEYKVITQYPIYVLSEQPLSETEINELENKYNLNLVVKEPLSFQYLGSSSYDPSYISTHEGYVMDTYFNWEHILKEEFLKREAENNGFTFNREIDFDKYDIIISFGREILEMQTAISEYGVFEHGEKELTVTFSNQHYGNEVFFYQIPKTSLHSSYWSAPYSIVENGEVIESGLSLKDANEIVEGFQGGL